MADSTTEPVRWCAECEQWLPFASFTRNRRRKDGWQPYCRACATVRVRRHRGVDPAMAGLRPQPWDRCAICGSRGGKKGLMLDHRHDDGTVRGWLCGRCNIAIGLLDEDPRMLEAAHRYLTAGEGFRNESG